MIILWNKQKGNGGSGGGSAKQVTLLSITTAPTGTFEKGSKYYDSTDKKIYTAVADDTWTGATESNAEFGTIYIYDNDGITEYYIWDGDNLVETDLEKYQLKSNITDSFSSSSQVTYPSSKALKDGLETAKPNLFDIKLLSQAIAGEEEKGWACMSHTTRKDLSKEDVPTLYENIKDKYDNVPTELQPIQTLSGSTYSGRVYADDTYVYFLGTDRYLRRCPLNNISSTTIENYLNNYQINGSNQDWYVGENIVVIFLNGSSNNGFIVIKKSDNTVLGYFSSLRWCMDLSVTKENGKTFVYATTSDDGRNRNYITYRIEDKEYTSETFTYETYNFYLEREQHTFNSIKYINGNYFFVSKLSYYGRVSIITIGNNFANISDLSKWVWKADDGNYGVIANSNIIITRYYISYDGGETFSSNNNLFPNNRTPQFFNCLNENVCYFSEYHYPNDLYSFTYENNTLTRTTIISNTVTLYDRVNNVVDDGNSFLISPTSATLIYSTVSKIVSTDTYQINGSSVAINYYKYNDWKICLPNATNDTNLDTVYNFLGYLNYWRLDTTSGSETISLPRNSNLWTMMYVGDDYEDSNLPTGNFSNAPKKIIGTSAPTTTTVGSVGDILVDVTNVAIYICTDVYYDTDDDEYVYVWSQLTVSVGA